MAFLLNGNPLAVDVPFTVGDTNYPANWLRLTTKAEKEAIGITEVADAPMYDSRFYTGRMEPLEQLMMLMKQIKMVI